MTHSIHAVRERTRQVLREAGLPDRHAGIVAGAMVDADVRGHHSHGLLLLPVYLRRIEAGGIDPAAEPEWIIERPALAVLSGRGAPGHVAAWRAAERCAALAERAGVAAVAVRHTNHVGMLAAYREPFRARGVVGLVLNLAGNSVAPPGGQRPTMGNNAVCLVMPRGDDEPFVIDFATGAVACGKIRRAAVRGEPVPEGWLLDADGRPSTDPARLDDGGAVPVFGGHKGLAVSLMVEVLAGVIGGGVTSRGVNRQRLFPARVMNCAQLFLGLHPAAFGVGDPAPFVDELRRSVREGYADDPPEPWFPEQAESCARQRAEREGLRLEPELAALLGL